MAVQIEKLLKSVPGYYRLVLVAAKRANELASGAPPLITTKTKKVAVIALEEISAGKVHDGELSKAAKTAKTSKAKKDTKTKKS